MKGVESHKQEFDVRAPLQGTLTGALLSSDTYIHIMCMHTGTLAIASLYVRMCVCMYVVHFMHVSEMWCVVWCGAV